MWSITCTSSSTSIFKESRPSLVHYNALKSLHNTLLGSLPFHGTTSASPLLPNMAEKNKKINVIMGSLKRARERDPKKRVVITGMGLVSVFGNDVDTFYNKLLDGASGITLIDRFDASESPVKIGGQIRNFSFKGYIDSKNDSRIDDCWKYCLVAGKEALHHANLTNQALHTMEKARMGVLVGSAMGGITVLSNAVETLHQRGYKKVSPFYVLYTISNMGSALLAMETGFRGPNYSISTACATSNHCLVAAANHIRRGDADVMVAGGVDAALNPIGIGSLTACRALSRRNNEPDKASRPWDRDRDGFVLAEGAGVLVTTCTLNCTIMERLDHAMKRGAEVYAEFLGGAANCDAHHMTAPHPDGVVVASCMLNSLQDAGVAPEEVNYVNAHATSTLLGDMAELNGLKKVFKNTSEMKMNATKSMIGHALGAAGALEAIATIKAINTGWLHPTINQYVKDSKLNLNIDTVPNVKKQHQVNVAISNSFGFGGHNSVVVLAPFKP